MTHKSKKVSKKFKLKNIQQSSDFTITTLHLSLLQHYTTTTLLHSLLQHYTMTALHYYNTTLLHYYNKILKQLDPYLQTAMQGCLLGNVHIIKVDTKNAHLCALLSVKKLKFLLIKLVEHCNNDCVCLPIVCLF